MDKTMTHFLLELFEDLRKVYQYTISRAAWIQGTQLIPFEETKMVLLFKIAFYSEI